MVWTIGDGMTQFRPILMAFRLRKHTHIARSNQYSINWPFVMHLRWHSLAWQWISISVPTSCAINLRMYPVSALMVIEERRALMMTNWYSNYLASQWTCSRTCNPRSDGKRGSVAQIRAWDERSNRDIVAVDVIGGGIIVQQVKNHSCRING